MEDVVPPVTPPPESPPPSTPSQESPPPLPEAASGGEGVPREERPEAVTDPVMAETLESLQEQVRVLQQAYKKGETPVSNVLGNAPLWGTSPQLAHQLQQPGQFRPGRFETKVFNLSESADRQEHDRILTEAQSEKASYIVNRERQWCPDDKSWRVLLEVQHFEFLQTFTHAKSSLL